MREQVLAHFQKHFGNGTLIWKNTEAQPIDLMFFPGQGERGSYHTIATIGLSEYPLNQPAGQEDYRRQELIAYIPSSWTVDLADKNSPATWVCMTLYYAARFSLTQVPLHVGSVAHTEDSRHATFFRYPWFLYVPPLIEKPEFYPLKVGTEQVEFLAATLITEAEGEYGKKHGPMALMKRLTDQGPDFLLMQPLRECCCGGDESKEEKAERMAMVDQALKELEEEEAQEAARKAPKATRARASVGREAKPVRPQSAARTAQKVEREEARSENKGGGQIGCIIGMVVFVGLAFFIGSNAYQPYTKYVGRLWATAGAVVIWIAIGVVWGMLPVGRQAKGRE